MKKILFIILAFSILLWGCGREDLETPAAADYNSVANNINVANVIAANDIIFSPTDGGTINSNVIYIYFPYDMPSSIIDDITIEADTSSGTGIDDLEMSYIPEMKAVKITGDFPDNRSFLLTLSGDIKSENGSFLDGNGSGKSEGAPYDDIKIRLVTGTGDISLFDIDAPELVWFFNTGNDVDITSDCWVIFKCPDNDLDTTTLENIVVVEKYDYENEEWETVDECSLAVDDIAYDGTYVWVPFDIYENAGDMEYGTHYRVTVDINDVTDVSGNQAYGVDMWDGYLAKNLYYQEVIPSVYFEFITEPDAGEDATPITVNNVNAFSDEHYIRVTFSEEVDTTTFSSSMIQIYNSNGMLMDFPVILEDNYQNARILMGNAESGTYMVVVSRELKDMAGWGLDGNYDGVDLEEADSYRFDPNGDDHKSDDVFWFVNY